MDFITATTDGGSRGNPGPASCAAIIRHGERVIEKLGEYIGVATNNVAEYSGIIAALRYARDKKVKGIIIYSDSEVVVKQMRREYFVHSEQLFPFWVAASEIAEGLEFVHYEHILRHLNTEADELCNLTLDSAKLLGKF